MRAALLLLAAMFADGCTIKVEPLPKKKKVVVKQVHHYHRPHASPTPAPDILRAKRYPVEDEQSKLIGPSP